MNDFIVMSFTDYNNILRRKTVTYWNGYELLRNSNFVMTNYLDYDLQQCTVQFVFQVTEFDVVLFQFSKNCFGEEFSRAKIEIILNEK